MAIRHSSAGPAPPRSVGFDAGKPVRLKCGPCFAHRLAGRERPHAPFERGAVGGVIGASPRPEVEPARARTFRRRSRGVRRRPQPQQAAAACPCRAGTGCLRRPVRMQRPKGQGRPRGRQGCCAISFSRITAVSADAFPKRRALRVVHHFHAHSGKNLAKPVGLGPVLRLPRSHALGHQRVDLVDILAAAKPRLGVAPAARPSRRRPRAACPFSACCSGSFSDLLASVARPNRTAIASGVLRSSA